MLKHSEEIEKKEKVRFDLYKILRMSILLSQNDVDEETLKKFQDASSNIDEILDKDYEKKLETLFYKTNTLEEEEDRLKKLVTLVKNRVEQRKSLIDDYQTITFKRFPDLGYINKSSELDLYETRLNTIKSYLDNSRLIKLNEIELSDLRDKLVKEHDKKQENEVRNSRLETSLYNEFMNVLSDDAIYSTKDFSNIDNEILELQSKIQEAKDQKDTFVTAFDNLKSSGITGELEIEYSSYVENSKKNYYLLKEEEYILKLYKLISDKKSDYGNLFVKREDIKDLLQERTLLRTELDVKEKDLLLPVSNLLLEQRQDIIAEKENIDNINNLTERIKLKESRLEELNKEIGKPEILSILKEFSLIDTYDHNELVDDKYDDNLDFELEEEKEQEDLDKEKEQEDLDKEEEEPETLDNQKLNLFEELLKEGQKEQDAAELQEEKEEVVPEKVYQDNQIKESNTVPTMNLGLSRLKSISVMKRVGDMLGANVKKEEPPVVVTPEVKKEEPKIEDKQDDLFWTPVEFQEMKEETTNTNNTFKDLPDISKIFDKNKEEDKIFVNNDKVGNSKPVMETNNIFDNKVNNDIFVNDNEDKKIFTEDKKDDIFTNTTNNNEIIFPEPIIPNNNKEQKEEDKFVWPESTDKFDVNGIFPN